MFMQKSVMRSPIRPTLFFWIL